jgi:transposase-like protein
MDGRVELHPEEQRAIGTMIMLRKEGVSLRNISKEIKSKHGISVSHETVNSILKKELSRTYLQ